MGIMSKAHNHPRFVENVITGDKLTLVAAQGGGNTLVRGLGPVC